MYCLAVLAVLDCLPAQASTITFATGPTTVGGRSINASAQFDFDSSAHTVTITLLNLLSNPADVTQGVGSIRFYLSGAGASPSPTLASEDISTFDVDSNGNPVTDNQSNTWTASNIGGTEVALCTVCSGGGNKELVIGGPSGNGKYTSANGGIAGNNAHNPFIIGSNATYASGALAGLDTSPSWILNIGSITPTVTVDRVIFGFGTGTNYGTNSMEVDTAVGMPEPGPLVTVVAGLALIGISAAWKKRARQRQP